MTIFIASKLNESELLPVLRYPVTITRQKWTLEKSVGYVCVPRCTFKLN